MPIPWNLHIASQYWHRRIFYVLDLGSNATKRIAKNLQSAETTRQTRQIGIAELQQETSVNSSNSQIVNSLRQWIETLSWSFCQDCGMLFFEKLRPSFDKGKKCNSTFECPCSSDRYVVPTIEQIPAELRELEARHVAALRPFDIDCGQYKTMRYGYRRKTALLRLTCSRKTVLQKIAEIPNETDREITIKAYNYLLSSPDSSYSSYLSLRDSYANAGNEPSLFNIYKWKGVECCLWPHLYPFTSWCESIHDGFSHRKSSKVSFLTKCLSSIVDYSLNFNLLQYVFDRWLYKTITGALNTSRRFSGNEGQFNAFTSLEDKPFSVGYWQWQHRYLIDAVRQFGLPSLFITISPSEWSFPLPLWLTRISEYTGYGPTRLPFFETMHFMNVLEQIVRGYLCGSNDCKWKNHLFNYQRLPTSNVLTYFYRFEFQKRGTLHVHLLVWLKNIKYIDYKHIRADLPSDDGELLYFVKKHQQADKSSLPIHDSSTDVVTVGNENLLNISHPPTANAQNVRGYIDTILPSLMSSMDVQCSNGRSMILKYVSGYVSKSRESYHSDALYCKTLNPATCAVKYAMQLDVCEPEMWVLLSSTKISWTNATRKQIVIPNSIEKAVSNTTVQKYYNRPINYSQMSFLEWLRSFDETSAVPAPYKDKKVVLVGVKHASIFNHIFFFQYLLMHLPHRCLEDILPGENPGIPVQILHFNTAVRLMPDTFITVNKFMDSFENEGHKKHFLETISSFLQSLIDMNNLYRRHLLSPSSNPLPSSSHDGRLQGGQLTVFNKFKDILEIRDRSFISPIDDSALDWKKFPLILGKPGSGKTYTIHKCIRFCIENDYNVAVAVPTGVLACTYREIYDDDVHCDTVHSLFTYQTMNEKTPSINWMLSQYDVIFIDEISQVSTDIFHHIIKTFEKLIRRPILILSGDFAQQQPIGNRAGKTTTLPNIQSCHHCMSHVVTFQLRGQYRTQDSRLVEILHHIRYDYPTDNILHELTDGRILSNSTVVDDSIYNILKNFPDAIILTMTRRASSYMNDIIVRNRFQGKPLALIVMQDETLIPVHKGMQLMLTQNINKDISFVNGQFVTVVSVCQNTVIVRHPRGHLINIFPVTRVVNDIPLTTYPCLPGYSTTISKIQGQTLDKIIVWIDTPTTPNGT
eukprot:gene3594-12991_t